MVPPRQRTGHILTRIVLRGLLFPARSQLLRLVRLDAGLERFERSSLLRSFSEGFLIVVEIAGSLLRVLHSLQFPLSVPACPLPTVYYLLSSFFSREGSTGFYAEGAPLVKSQNTLTTTIYFPPITFTSKASHCDFARRISDISRNDDLHVLQLGFIEPAFVYARSLA